MNENQYQIVKISKYDSMSKEAQNKSILCAASSIFSSILFLFDSLYLATSSIVESAIWLPILVINGVYCYIKSKNFKKESKYYSNEVNRLERKYYNNKSLE